MQKEGFDKNKLHVIYNSLNYQEQLKIRSRLEKNSVYKNYFDNDHPVLLFIGRLTKIKKLNMLIEALDLSIRDNKFFNLILIGDGKERQDLEAIVKKLGLERHVWFYGACYDEYIIGELIYNAYLCISPGNIGLTAIHSLTFGTPCITHNNFKSQMPEFEAIKESINWKVFHRK